MATKKTRRLAGISRIDQAEKRTHGFFVRLTRKGKTHSAFFADRGSGGKGKALAAARKHYAALVRQHGALSRQDWAQIPRRPGRSGIIGVQKAVIQRGNRTYRLWQAVWSPRPGVHRRRMFSIEKYGASRAKALAIQARKAGVREMAQ